MLMLVPIRRKMEFLADLLKIELSNNSTVPEFEDFEQFDDSFIPVWRRILWTILFSTVTVVGTTGNAIVIWIVLAHKVMRTVTNLFIVNLAVADALVALLNVTFSSYSMIYTDWPFGKIYCKLTEFISGMNIAVSVLTLAAMSVDRYIAIMYPFQKRIGKKKTLLVIVAIWASSFIVSMPNWIFYTTTASAFGPNDVRMICHSDWPDTYFGQFQERAHTVFFTGITYFLPLACMTFTYARLGEQLWVNHSIGECTQIQIDNIRAKRKIVKMMIIVVAIFAICWLPHHLLNLILTIANRAWPIYMREVYMACFWLAMSNSMYNPIIYCWMNKKFRTGFRKSFSWCPGIEYTPGKILEDSNISNRTNGTKMSSSLD